MFLPRGTFSSAHDGARHVLEAADGSVFEKIVKLLDDDATPTSAKTSACETLGGCTLTDEGVHAGLEGALTQSRCSACWTGRRRG